MKKLWTGFAVVFLLSFAVLGWIGTRIYQEMPPIPARIVSTDGITVAGPGDVGRGQNVWQSLGGMEVGSVWGHGSYVAPDWTADWLHRESMFVLDEWARAEHGAAYGKLPAEQQAALQGRLEQMYRRNTYDAAANTITIDPVRARAFEATLSHYADVFMKGHPAYAIPAGTVSTPERMREFGSFIFWTAWAAAANRVGDHVSYTHNWPYEPLVGNRPTGESVIWTGVSIIMLLAGICAMVWWYASQKERPREPVPAHDPLRGWQSTPSQRATLKYFWAVSALIVAQILMGMVTAHYGVEGGGFYGLKIARWLPYAVAR
ncbi:MAG: nitric-oxide reductase large subunit, partial [Acidobacteriota bacterium]|nr:nitric-oxide reductase large subunit [Acidobacteriota bacterium]